MIALRVIVQHSYSSKMLKVFSLLFLSWSAVINFVSGSAAEMGALSMVQALLGVNTLVGSNEAYLGMHTIYSTAVYFAYAINGLWLLVVGLMVYINRLKSNGEENWLVRHQGWIYRNCSLLAVSLCLLYIPLFTAYSTDEGNGKQETKMWAWALVITLISLLFVGGAVKDYLWQERRKKEEREVHDGMAKSANLMFMTTKPLNTWSVEEVSIWTRVGAMQQAEYFTVEKRDTIEEKLQSEFVNGLALYRYGSDVETLRSMGLQFGDAMMLADEVKELLSRSNNIETAVTTY